MNGDMISIALRVTINCIVFAYFLFEPFKSRFRYSYLKTMLLALLLTVITVGVTILFLTTGKFLSAYSGFGVILWMVSAITIFHIAIKRSTFEILFIVLVVLNLYVNVAAISKVIVKAMNLHIEEACTMIRIGVLAAYIPCIWFLMAKLYKQVIEFDMNYSFWRFIWVIPALTYLMFYVKIVEDYWRSPIAANADDVAFVVLWSFTSYVFFCVTLELLIQIYKGITTARESHLIASQLKMQEEQYEEMIEHIEKTARLRHDWRHHLMAINGFAENNKIEDLRRYLKEMIPEYLVDQETAVCQNHIADVILRHYAAIAKAHGAEMTIEANICTEIPIQDTDLCILFGNLVENAVEACIDQKNGIKSIEIKAKVREKQLIFMIKNTYQKKVIFKKGVYHSTKHEGVGVGLSSVKKVVEKNHGLMKIQYDEIYFKVYVLLNFNDNKAKARIQKE